MGAKHSRRARAAKANMYPEDVMRLARGEFAAKLLRELCSSAQSSVVLAPFSVTLGLGMAYAGAKNETAEEIASAIAKGENRSDKIHSELSSVVRSLSWGDKEGDYVLETANRIYVKESFPLLEDYKKCLNENYAGQFQSVDFAEGAETAKIINDFVEEKTHSKIKKMVDGSELDAERTCLLLINTIYLKSNWEKEFCPAQTETKPFYVAPGRRINVEMMQKGKSEMSYGENKDFQVESGLSIAACTHVSIPKFKIESKHNLVGTLKKLGIERAFSEEVADFSGISGGKGLYISDVIQKTDEKGSEAAAALEAKMYMCCELGPPTPPPPKVYIFKADHPFAFIISRYNDILFGGVVREP